MLSQPAMRHKRSHFLPRSDSEQPWQAHRVAEEIWLPNKTVDRPEFRTCFFAIVLNGKAKLLANGNPGELRPGMLFCMMPDHAYRMHIHEDLHLRIITGLGSDLILATRNLIHELPAIWKPQRFQCFEQLFDECMHVSEKSGQSAAPIVNNTLRLLIALLQHNPTQENQSGSAATFSACAESIARHALSINDVAEAADMCNIDRAYLSRLFKRYAGESPSAFLLRHKMTYAAEQLASGNSVADCAKACGYRSADVFSRAFQRHFGHTPRKWLSLLE